MTLKSLELKMGSPANQQEEKWKAEFEATGETAIRNDRSGVNVGISDEPKRQYAFRWLREKERDRERFELDRAQRESSAHWYAKWTFWAAVAAVLIGIVGVIVTIFAGH
jgi:hypothetical protein